jgi:putative hydrolase of the HAD superfamily
MLNTLVIFDLDDTLFSRLPDGHSEEQLNQIKLYPHLNKFLNRRDIKKALVTKGDEDVQRKKIASLGIKNHFDDVLICSEDIEKKECFENLLQKYPQKIVWIIGDRIDSEIRWGNELGLNTIRLKKGKYKELKVSHENQKPDYEIEDYVDLSQILSLP